MSWELAGTSALVTGGTGSIGRALVDELVTLRAKRVVVFSRDEMKHFHLRREMNGLPVETVVGDVRDARSVDAVCRQYRFDVVFHVAAMKHVSVCEDSPYEAALTNVVGTQNVLDSALRHAVRRVVVVSTDKAVQPTTVLGATKLLAERLTIAAARSAPQGQVLCCVRFGNVLGSRGSVVPVWLDALRNGLPLEVTDPAVTRFAMRIAGAARLVVRAGCEAQGGELFVLKMKAFELGELAAVMKNRIAPSLGRQPEDVKVVVTGLVPGEKLHEELLSADEVARTRETEDALVVLPWPRREDACASTGNRWCGSSELAPRLTPDELEDLAVECLTRGYRHE
ncbi:MAG: polysaccharide biosynthesis protein [Dehalococcoidia bacterium]|jgi:FlaA1/EpsC-like NDP-sugar epimerase|nr:polysaccharide biosynthesis protein [Dehalococcoidia bacterium]